MIEIIQIEHGHSDDLIILPSYGGVFLTLYLCGTDCKNTATQSVAVLQVPGVKWYANLGESYLPLMGNLPLEEPAHINLTMFVKRPCFALAL